MTKFHFSIHQKKKKKLNGILNIQSYIEKLMWSFSVVSLSYIFLIHSGLEVLYKSSRKQILGCHW